MPSSGVGWKARLFPELLLFEEKKLRRQAWQKAFNRMILKPTYWVFVVVGIVVAINLKLFIRSYLALLPLPVLWEGVIVGGMSGLLVTYVPIRVFHKTIRHSLRLQLLAIGVRVCATCSYDLRGSVKLRCPECGTPLEGS